MDAVAKVRERLLRATRALDADGVPYAVAGGNAVADWVARVDEGATRATKDVDLLVNRSDFPAVQASLERAGFIYHNLFGVDTFIDGEKGRPSEGVHLLHCGEAVKPGDVHTLPTLDESERGSDFQVANLGAIARMKLMAYRRKDQVHLLDMIGVGLIDATWPAKFPPPLGDRLQQLLDDPDG
jgi:hypothetical protein